MMPSALSSAYMAYEPGVSHILSVTDMLRKDEHLHWAKVLLHHKLWLFEASNYILLTNTVCSTNSKLLFIVVCSMKMLNRFILQYVRPG